MVTPYLTVKCHYSSWGRMLSKSNTTPRTLQRVLRVLYWVLLPRLAQPSHGNWPSRCRDYSLPSGGIIAWEDTTETTVTLYGWLWSNFQYWSSSCWREYVIDYPSRLMRPQTHCNYRQLDIDGSYTALVTLTSPCNCSTLTLASVGNSTYISSAGTVQIEGVDFHRYGVFQDSIHKPMVQLRWTSSSLQWVGRYYFHGWHYG